MGSLGGNLASSEQTFALVQGPGALELINTPSHLSLCLHLCLFRRGFPGEAWSLRASAVPSQPPPLSFTPWEEVAVTLLFPSPLPVQEE